MFIGFFLHHTQIFFFAKKSAHLHESCNLLRDNVSADVQIMFRGVQIR